MYVFGLQDWVEFTYFYNNIIIRITKLMILYNRKFYYLK